ncbi:hypothetical protein NA56DRAFT_700952 [Hyaloscypha hepaticicola]|uniref:Uncharacterized protein n=1 Tax=Hyaloscypha hepaticicola TaxID=2082293 RepID=A0A2J6QBB2_9HELO|nr:hypothetical protein NA56DRAFT_700952 [Hyaloscypha hepaticicola]
MNSFLGTTTGMIHTRDICICHVVALAPEPNPRPQTRRQLISGSENFIGDETKPFIAQIPYSVDLNSDDRPALSMVQRSLRTVIEEREAAATPFLHVFPREALLDPSRPGPAVNKLCPGTKFLRVADRPRHPIHSKRTLIVVQLFMKCSRVELRDLTSKP